MKFVEMTGKSLAKITADGMISAGDLKSMGINDDTVVRVNEHGDIEVRKPHKWDVVGGLLGNYRERIEKQLKMEWV